MKKALLVVSVAVASLAAVLAGRTLGLESRQIAVEPATPLELDADRLAEHLAGALRFRTISYADRELIEPDEFRALNAYLEETLPLVHQRLTREVVNELSLLFTWRGSDPGLRPMLLMAHSDAVPVEPGTEGEWTYPPFAGRVADGYVWGRGAMDDKGSELAILDAVEALLATGFVPERTVYLAFGHDEEIGGGQGARAIAELLEDRGVELEYVLDEGREVWDGAMLGVDRPVALIGLAEKGYLTVRLTARAPGGHSSMPARQSAIGVLASAIHALEANPMPAAFEGPVEETFAFLAPEMPFVSRVMHANRWLFGGMLTERLGERPYTNALIRTPTAVTLIDGGVKDNVLPLAATAAVNFRLHPGDTGEDVYEHVRQVIDDERVEVTGGAGRLASPVSPTESFGFEAIHRSIRQVAPEVIVAPGIFFATTDARHYQGLTNQVFRFLPMSMDPEELTRYHSTDERISVADYERLVRFYAQLVRNSGG